MFSVVTLSFWYVLQTEEGRPVEKEKGFRSKDSSVDFAIDLNHDDFYFPSVDLLTAQVHTT